MTREVRSRSIDALVATGRRLDTGVIQPLHTHNCAAFAACKNGCALGRKIAFS